MDGNEFALKEGAEYHIKMFKEDTVRGKFRGYVSLCGENAIVIEKSDKRVRYIPVAQIIYIDQEEYSVHEEKPKNIDIYYR